MQPSMSSSSRWSILLSISLFMLAINMNITIVALALANIGLSLKLTFSTMQWISNGYTLSAALCLIPFSSLSRRWSNRNIYLLSVILFTVGSLIAGVSQSAVLLIVGRVCQGLGFAGLPLGIVIVSHSFPPKERGMAYSVSVASVGIGLALGPILGSWILSYFTWHAIFYVNVAIGAFCLLSSMTVIRPDEPLSDATHFDWLGTGWLFLTLVPSMILLSKIRWWGFMSELTWLTFGLSVIGTVGLIRHVHQHEHPLFDPVMLKNRNATLCLLVRTVFMICFAAILFMVPLQLQNIDGFGSDYAAKMMLVMTLIMTVLSPYCGRMIDRLGFKTPVLISVGFCLASHLLFALSPGYHPVLTILGLASFGVAAAFMFAAGTYGMSHSLTMAHKSTGMALFFTAANIGISCGVTLSGSLVSWLSERSINAVIASKQWVFSQAMTAHLHAIASGVKPLSSLVGLSATQMVTLRDSLTDAYMTGFHGLMWACVVLAFIQLLWSYQLNSELLEQ